MPHHSHSLNPSLDPQPYTTETIVLLLELFKPLAQ